MRPREDVVDGYALVMVGATAFAWALLPTMLLLSTFRKERGIGDPSNDWRNFLLLSSSSSWASVTTSAVCPPISGIGGDVRREVMLSATEDPDEVRLRW